MKIRHLFEDYDEDELFWESMQDAGWKPLGYLLLSPKNSRIAVDRNQTLYYRGRAVGIHRTDRYTDSKHAELLRFERDPEVQKKLCMQYKTLLRFASEAVQLAAVQQDGEAIEYIENPSEALQLAAVRQNGNAIEYIEDPSEAVQLAAVQKYGTAIRYIRRPFEIVQLTAVRQDGWVIQYIKNPSEAVQLAAVRRNGDAIQFIKNPCEAVKLAAVQKYGTVIRFIEDPSEAVKRAARAHR